MTDNFLGVSWSCPVTLGAQDKTKEDLTNAKDQAQKGPIRMAFYEDAVRQSIWMILSTAPGERLMRPEFGCGIHNQVFMPNSADVIGRVISDVQRSLIEWEPRIDVLDVDAFPDEALPTCLLIQINYRVRTTNNRFNLVYPFYLE